MIRSQWITKQAFLNVRPATLIAIKSGVLSQIAVRARHARPAVATARPTLFN
jgi:hypothetical protein